MFRNPLTDGLVVLVVLLLFFGPKRLPELGKGIGEGIRGFKSGIGGDSSEDEKPQLTASEQADTTDTTKAPAAREAVEGGTERSS